MAVIARQFQAIPAGIRRPAATLALFATVLGQWAAEPGNVPRVVQMLLIHDLVEVEAGDTPLFAERAAQEQALAEQAAASKLFGMLPADQGEAFRALWEKFEAAATPDARFCQSTG